MHPSFEIESLPHWQDHVEDDTCVDSVPDKKSLEDSSFSHDDDDDDDYEEEDYEEGQEEDDKDVVLSFAPYNLHPTTVIQDNAVPLVAEFGNMSTREKRDVFCQWLKPALGLYSQTTRHSDKDMLVNNLILAWAARGGTFRLYTNRRTARRGRQQNDQSSSHKPGTFVILNPHDATDLHKIAQCTKLKLAKLSYKWRKTSSSTQHKLDLLIAMLRQA